VLDEPDPDPEPELVVDDPDDDDDGPIVDDELEPDVIDLPL
jgi:hypothetical protein